MNHMEVMKKCRYCLEAKPLDQFYSYVFPYTQKVMHHRQCKQCLRLKQALKKWPVTSVPK
jgi:hypothetical protein